MTIQILTLRLADITAGDYLQWVRDPDPPALSGGLRSVGVQGDPLGDTITAILDWAGPAPPAQLAAPSAGLPLSAGVRVWDPLTRCGHLDAGDGRATDEYIAGRGDHEVTAVDTCEADACDEVCVDRQLAV